MGCECHENKKKQLFVPSLVPSLSVSARAHSPTSRDTVDQSIHEKSPRVHERNKYSSCTTIGNERGGEVEIRDVLGFFTIRVFFLLFFVVVFVSSSPSFLHFIGTSSSSRSRRDKGTR